MKKKKVIRRPVRKPKTGGYKKASVTIVLDETGSMSGVKDATIRGYNEFISTLKSDKTNPTVSLTKFNSGKTEVVYKDLPVSKVPELTAETYNPNHMTPLYDAIGKTIVAMDAVPASHLLVIITDGEENSSAEYKKDDIQKMIKDREAKGWRFMYLGANQDSWANSSAMGIAAGNSINFVASATGTQKAFRTVAAATMAYTRALDEGTDYSLAGGGGGAGKQLLSSIVKGDNIGE